MEATGIPILLVLVFLFPYLFLKFLLSQMWPEEPMGGTGLCLTVYAEGETGIMVVPVV